MLESVTRLGPYDPRAAPLGAGGMGEVYRARSLAREPQALERFRREARAASAPSHPGGTR
jgi:hypothetical protein